jgi:hypothetical protein
MKIAFSVSALNSIRGGPKSHPAFLGSVEYSAPSENPD